jgi:hypothetical protein
MSDVIKIVSAIIDEIHDEHIVTWKIDCYLSIGGILYFSETKSNVAVNATDRHETINE